MKIDENFVRANDARFEDEQYSLGKIILIWLAVAVPMPIGAFVLSPMLASGQMWDIGLVIWSMMIAGMVWQFILSIILLRLENVPFKWSALKQRLWLEKPTDPKTGKSSYKLFWWLIPAFLFYAAIEMSPFEAMVADMVTWLFPFLEKLPSMDIESLARPEFAGAWWLMGIAIISSIFNYFLGEELLFRGVLLPKMKGAFGRWDWVANSVLFAFYHLHRPTQMLAFAIGGLAYSLPSRRFKSIWFAVILHGLEGLLLLGGVFAVVSGLAFP
ncbi:CAAX prenyl protease-like protein [Maritalea mobilis]|uniref:CAAX prenyl protease-like protein n=1 Tax=Maritalea mobilis TaxID=483324 RepID=A0A4R6VJB8_9HYPH|nr:CPBP family intramembrane glutamic endopeptidase [Maritalea mobilis]TDQ61686.1 CAAX prenyl protease-like protein [Maritalea mobilis]